MAKKRPADINPFWSLVSTDRDFKERRYNNKNPKRILEKLAESRLGIGPEYIYLHYYEWMPEMSRWNASKSFYLRGDNIEPAVAELERLIR